MVKGENKMKKLVLGMLLSVALPVLAQAAEYKIEMKFNEDSGDVYFEPKELKIHAGDTVIFTHADPYNVHNVMFEAVPNGADIPMMSQEEMNEGDTWQVTFAKSGTYKYHCHPHYDMGMEGEIIVDYASRPVEMHEDDHPNHEHG
jgi:plastocyanin